MQRFYIFEIAVKPLILLSLLMFINGCGQSDRATSNGENKSQEVQDNEHDKAENDVIEAVVKQSLGLEPHLTQTTNSTPHQQSSTNENKNTHGNTPKLEDPIMEAQEILPDNPKELAPVPKPKQIPKTLAKVFSDDPAITAEDKLTELREIAYRRNQIDAQDALRWFVYQPAFEIKIRNAALNTMGNWNPSWLLDDLIYMAQDSRHSVEWRRHCTEHLARYYAVYRREPALKALLKAAESTDISIREIATFALARLSADFQWAKRESPEFPIVVKIIDLALTDKDPAMRLTGVRSVGAAGLNDKVTFLERMAQQNDETVEIRKEALSVLRYIARPESLEVFEKLAADPQYEIAKEAKAAIPFAYILLLRSADTKIANNAFYDLQKLKLGAKDALLHGIRTAPYGDRSTAIKYLYALMSELILNDQRLPLVVVGNFENLPLKEKRPENETVKIDKSTKSILTEGEFCRNAGSLEYIIVCKGPGAKTHEALVMLDCKVMDLVAALLVQNYAYAGELREGDRVNLKKEAGVMFSIQFTRDYLTPEGLKSEEIRIPIETMVWNADTNWTMKRAPWAFTGSRWVQIEDRRVLAATKEQSIAAIRSDPDALFNTVLDTYELADIPQGGSGLYDPNFMLAPSGDVPEERYRIKLIIEPWKGGELTEEDIRDSNRPKQPRPEDEKK